MAARSPRLDLANKSCHLVENLLQESIFRRDLKQFSEIVRSRADVMRTAFGSVPPLIDLIQLVVQEKFLEGLDFLLEFYRQYYLCGSESEENSGVNKARKAFMYATQNDSDDIIRVFLHRIVTVFSDLHSNLSILPLRDVYAHAMRISDYDLAREVVELDEFSVNDISSVSGEPPLHTAVRCHQPNLTELILARGATVDQLDRRGISALCVAASVYDLDICRLLLANGSSISANQSYGLKSPIYCLFSQAFFNPDVFQAEKQSAYDICYLLCSVGLEPTQVERWWLDMLAGKRFIDTERLHERAARGFREPISLQTLCLRNIRERMCNVREGKGCMRDINKLPLPLHMKRLLSLELL